MKPCSAKNVSLVALAFTALAAGTAHSQAVEEIIVTGTRRADRSVKDSSVPVDILSARDLQSTASFNLQDKLAQAVPSFTVQSKPLYGTLIFVRPASLRGLNPDQTLVLVNGKRQHRTPFVDFNILGGGAQAVDLSQISSSALGRVEVLRDGASAQYGSDAIAGVINLVLDERPGVRAFVQTGQYYEGDGEGLQAGINAGWRLGQRGRLNASFEYAGNAFTSRALQREAATALAEAGNTHIRQPAVTTWGQPDTETSRLSLNGQYALNATANLYGFALYGRSTGESNVNWRAPDSASYARSVFQDAPFGIYSDYTPLSRFPGGYTPFLKQQAEDISLVAGLKGEINDRLSYDVSGNYGRGRLRQNAHHTLNPSLGPDSPDAFYLGQTTQAEWTLNLDFVYRLNAGLAAPVNLAFGSEYRKETWSVKAGEYASWAVGPLADLPSGSGGQVGILPDAAGRWSRDSLSVYADIDADLTERLNAAVAVRYEDYADFGSTVNGKLASRFKVNDGLSLRGALSTGFRAPTPGQSNATNTQQSPDPLRPGEIKIISLIPATSALARSFGAQPLKPEKSVNLSLGAVATPAPGLSLTADIYTIRVKDRLTISQSFTPETGREYQFFVNGYKTRTEGIDIVASYATQLGATTRLNLTAAFNYNRTKILSAQAGLVGEAQRIALTHRLPEHSAILGAELRTGRFEITTRLRHYGDTIDLFFDSEAFSQTIPSETFVDLALRYDLSQQARVSVGAENLFDTYPARVNWGGPLSADNYLDFGRKYPSALPYSTNGGYYYVRLDFTY